jgi:Tfp pilus assembly protein FimT
MIAELNNLSSAIQYTRFNAIDTQVSTLLCPSADFQKCN